MKHLRADTAQNHLYTLLDDVIERGETFSITTEKGAAILVSYDEWSGMRETLYLQSIPGMTESIIEAREAPASERLEDIGWDIS